MPILLDDRKQVYLLKLNALNAKCRKCIKQNCTVNPERCEYCYVGRSIRMLEAEYADATGWSHKTWQSKKQMCE